MKNDLTIIVNSSDGFEDCWDPFFKLFSTFWPNCEINILLNTEHKSYAYPGLNISTSKSNSNNPERRLTWSECLINTLHQVKTPFVLYLQEDYFVEKLVLIDVIADFVKKMGEDPSIKYIGLTHFGNYAPFKPWQRDSRLWEVSQNTRYRISTQAGIWQRDILLSYLRPDENGWMFEIFATKRSYRRNELFLTANRDIYSPVATPIMQYEHTGIIKGKWHPLIPALFAKHQIKMDFSKRGMYNEKPWLLRKIETARKLLKNPAKFYNGMRGL